MVTTEKREDRRSILKLLANIQKVKADSWKNRKQISGSIQYNLDLDVIP